MADDRYQRLLAAVADFESLDEKIFQREQRYEKDGVAMRFQYLERARLCRVGMVLDQMPEGDVDGLRAMLESNAFPEVALLPVMAFDAELNRPMVFVHFPMDDHVQAEMLCFLDVGRDVFLSQWREIWVEDAQAARPDMGALA